MSCCQPSRETEPDHAPIAPSRLASWTHLILMAAVVILVPLLLSRLSRPPAASPAVISANPQAVAPAALRSVSENGVDADVLSALRKDGTTTIRLALNNHRYDLADPRIASRSSLAGATPRDWKILSSGSGGHHAEVEAVFDGELSGDLRLGVTQDITLTIPDL